MHLTAPLFSRHLRLPSDARILLLEGDGELARLAADMVPQGEVRMLACDVRQVAAARAMLLNTPNAHAGDEVLPKEQNTWDAVLIAMPKGRRYGRTLLWAAWSALRPGGQLYVAGATQTGANAFFADAGRLFGNVQLLGYKKRQRIARSMRGAALPEPVPPEFLETGVAPGEPRIVTVTRPEGVLHLATHPGIFSWEKLDEGARLLLDALHIRPGERVWDVGCGAGVIGLSAALAKAGAVMMTDVNLLAVAYAQRNAEHQGLASRVQVHALDSIDEQFGRWDLIVANPAFHEGHQVDTSMADALIGQAPSVLAPGGRLLLVSNRFLAYDKKMHSHFQHVTRVFDSPQYHVLEAC